jgi:hypothetical protein
MLLSTASMAQPRTDTTLRVTVVDPSGAVIVGARVTLRHTRDLPTASETDGSTLDTAARGEAVFTTLEPGTFTIHVESPGFEPADVAGVRVRAGDNRREVKLKIAKLAETVQVGRDPRERASDPRGNVRHRPRSAQIDDCPTIPTRWNRCCATWPGPDRCCASAVSRRGHLPPKGQIQQIRFRRNMFAADTHEPGFVSIDITTKPGIDNWRGSTGLGFRSDALSARNAFAPVKGDEQYERYSFSVSGPLWKQHTSLSLSADGTDAFDSKTIVAALPSGYFSDTVRKPNDSINFTARLEHMLTKSQMFRAEFQRSHSKAENLGVGDYDLIDRGYRQTRTENVLRASNAGAIGKTMYNELRVQWLNEGSTFTPTSVAPAVLVLNAFNAGGAQLVGSSGSDVASITDDLDIAKGRHAIRAGVQLDAGLYRTSELRNSGGTFTFASLDAYDAGMPTTYSRNAGDPRVAISQAQLGLYVQDDIRARKDLTVSAGLRQEYQSLVGGFNLAPRGGITWSPFKSGKTTIRTGGGVFFDWFDAQTYEQAVQLDGTHQQIETVMQPGYPNVRFGDQTVVLPAGRVQFAPNLAQPRLTEAIAAVEQALPGDVRVNTMYIARRGTNQLRGVNINAPLANGLRPDPASGAITEIQSVAATQFDAISVNLNYSRPQQRLFIAANYTFGRSRNDTDSPFGLPADNYNLAAERGPALGFSRHRFMSLANVPLKRRFRLGTSLRVQSPTPYNITTGRDDNGDTVSSDRPAGVTRNTGLGATQIDLGLRLSWSLAFGGAAPPPAGPQVRVVRGDSADPLSGMGGMRRAALALELYVQAYNALNHFNALNFSGVLSSPFYGQPTAAAAPRRVEIGGRIGF